MLGAGAYLSVPVGIAAWITHVPIALLEINSIPGSANKLLARFAKKYFLRIRNPKRNSRNEFLNPRRSAALRCVLASATNA